MNNVDKLTDTLIHIEHVLEKNIPKGYHEVVQEYINQNIVAAIVSIIALIAVVILTVFIIKKYYSLSPKARDDNDIFFWLYIIFAICAVIYLGVWLTISVQRAVAPNWYILQRLLNK